MIVEGKVWKFGDNMNTDLMMPGQDVIARPGITDEEAARHCMSAIRPGWTSHVNRGDIIVAGRNWGCGSSRPAARLFKALGIGVIVADSITRVFFRNAVNTGLPVLICEGVSEFLDEGDTAQINMEQGEVTNLTTGKSLTGEALPPDSPPFQILNAGGLMSFMEQEAVEGTA
jgi:3-isopropylmalate/(R)-2-methylmalate dehydratase small subunit